ncbi:MAG: HD domain-containing phosphohydrolase, partial [Bacillota bacterium]|nr:HD domain-containing phosphohydrolase [Bacillota bacterium]
ETITDSHRNFIGLLKQKLTVAFYKSILITDLLSTVTNSLANLAEAKDPETGQHLKRMSLYSQVIASELRHIDKYKTVVNDEYVTNIGYAAPMHDIGKVAIKDDILLKPGKLTEDEFTIMKTHSEAGGHVLDAIDLDLTRFDITYFKMASDIAWGHHEKYDGTGYPKGLKKEDIPLSARICAIADVFDALSTKRPYKEPFELDKCYEILKEGSGKHFDPELLEVFFDKRNEIEKIFNHNRE